MSWKPVIAEAGKPKYLALVEAIEADIATGRLQAGERLPPQRELATGLGVTIATVTRAIGEANRRGLVSARTGSGTFIRLAPSIENADTARDLSINTVPSGPAKAILDEVLQDLASEKRSEEFLGYEPTIGTDRHRRAVAGWFEGRVGDAAPSDAALTHGTQHGLAACFAGMVRPGDTVLTERWTYSGVRRLAANARAHLTGVDLDGEGMRPDRLADALERTGSRLVICSAAVQNPTAISMSLERRMEILRVCKAADAILIEDDIYGRLSGDPIQSFAALDPTRVIYLGSVSKCISPGFRLGVMTAPGHLAPDLNDKLVSLHWTAPSFFAEMFTRMIESGAADRCVGEHQREMDRRLSLAERYLGPGILPDLPSYHLWLAAPDGWRLDDLVVDLLSRGIRVSPSSHFLVEESGSAPPHIRVSLGAAENVDALAPALRALAAVFSSSPRLTGAVV